MKKKWIKRIKNELKNRGEKLKNKVNLTKP